MKINPDIGQLPPTSALPTPPLTVQTGDPSPFAAMLGQPTAEPTADRPGPGSQGGGAKPSAAEPEVTEPELAGPRLAEPKRAEPAGVERAPLEPGPVRGPDPRDLKPGAPAVSAGADPAGATALQVAPMTTVEPGPVSPEDGAPASQTVAPDTASPKVSLVAPQPTSTPKPEPRQHFWDAHGPHGRPIVHRAFGFRELGVWGHGGPIAEVAGPRTCGVTPDFLGTKADAGVTAPDPALQSGPLPTDRDRGDRRIAAGIRPPTGDQDSDTPHRIRPERSSASSHRHPLVRPGQLQTREEGVDEEIEAIAPEAAEQLAATPEPSTPLSVSVSDGAGGLQVVAAMADINPDAVARLRRIAQSLAREFGLSLAEFSLNGAVVDAPAMSDRSTQWR